MDHDDEFQTDSMRGGTNMADQNDADTPAEPIDHRLRLQTELARAMQAAARHERDRIAAAIRDDAELDVDRTRARGAVESAEFHRLAEDEVEQIRVWSDAEIKRIRDEATRRIDERNVDLATFLRRHESMIETEVEAVATAVRLYETTLDQFFIDMTSSIDPAYIVRQADLVPHPPDLEVVRAVARVDTLARFHETDDPRPDATETVVELPDTVGVGVMDPEAVGSVSNIAVRLWRSVASSSLPSADPTVPRDR